MSTIKQYTSAGEAGADIEVDEASLVLDKGAQALKDAVVAIRNAMRAGTASTKGKGEVAGSNKKPWKQKGTGNARAGFRQSPVWRGGGVAHGPKPRDFGFARAVSEKIQAGDVLVVSEFAFEAPKTKLMAAFLKKIGIDRSALIVTAEINETLDRMVRNLPRVDSATAQEINPYAVLLFRKIVCDKAGYDALMARVAGKENK